MLTSRRRRPFAGAQHRARGRKLDRVDCRAEGAMDEMTEWSESDKTLYVAVVPILALIAALVVLAAATSSSRHASAASGVPLKVDTNTLAIAERVRDGALATRRNLYNGCFADMGLQTGIAAQIVHPEKEK